MGGDGGFFFNLFRGHFMLFPLRDTGPMLPNASEPSTSKNTASRINRMFVVLGMSSKQLYSHENAALSDRVWWFAGFVGLVVSL